MDQQELMLARALPYLQEHDAVSLGLTSKMLLNCYLLNKPALNEPIGLCEYAKTHPISMGLLLAYSQVQSGLSDSSIVEPALLCEKNAEKVLTVPQLAVRITPVAVNEILKQYPSLLLCAWQSRNNFNPLTRNKVKQLKALYDKQHGVEVAHKKSFCRLL